MSPADAGIILNHVRPFLLQEADQRGKNFNYFLFVCAALVTALKGSDTLLAYYLILLAGILLSCIFFLIDRRNFRLILDARAELYPAEKALGIRLHARDAIADPSAGILQSARRRLVSLTTAYSLVYGLSVLACVFGFVVVFLTKRSG